MTGPTGLPCPLCGDFTGVIDSRPTRLALAAADVERRFAEFLGARHIPGAGNMATATITAQDAAQVPEIAALVDASTALRDSLRQFAGTGRMLGSVDDRYRAVDAALRAIAEVRP